MKTVELNKKIDALANKQGITKYTIDSMSLTDGNFKITPEGKLVKERFIDVKIIPINCYLKGIPITFSVKDKRNE